MIEIFFLSLLQGITEFLPISSSSHLIIFSQYANFENQSFHFGTPSVAVQDLNHLHEFAVDDDVPIHLQRDTHVYLKDYGECSNQKTEDGEPSLNRTDDLIDTLEDYEVILKDEHGDPRVDEEGNAIKVICRPPSDLLGRVFLTKPDQRGNRQRARIVEVIKDFEDEVDINKNRLSRNFRVQLERGAGQEAFEDIMAYNDILAHLERKENNTHTVDWHFRKILRHQHTPVGHKDRINSDYNVDVLWETGAISTESVQDLSKEFKVDLALYAKENELLEEECWKQFKHTAAREKHLIRLVKQARL